MTKEKLLEDLKDLNFEIDYFCSTFEKIIIKIGIPIIFIVIPIVFGVYS